MRRPIPVPTVRQRAVIAATALILSSAACTDAQDPTVGDPPTATAPTSPAGGPVGTTTDETTGETSGAQAERIEITVSGGEVDGPGTVPLDPGTDVELIVTSDVDDHIHVHGYDIFQDVTAGGSATLTFTADIPGVFEVELEDSGTHLVELQVSG